jgi:hypothetical protein
MGRVALKASPYLVSTKRNGGKSTESINSIYTKTKQRRKVFAIPKFEEGSAFLNDLRKPLIFHPNGRRSDKMYR